MNKYNSSLPSSNCSREDGVCSKRRARSISPQHKAKNPCKSSLDYSFGCNFCGLKFSGMESLQCHMPCEGSVTSKDPLKCGACGKTFRESLDMEKHLQGLHKNKLFKCEICSKNCASKSCLVWHMQIHVDIRSEKCENQSNTFLSRDAKTSHKSSECTICNKGFLSKLCLQSHMKQHKEIERESHSHVIVESSIILEKNSNSQGPMNRSFQDALDIRKLLTSDFVNKHAEYQVQNSRKHAERERSSWSIFDQVRLCDSASNSPFDHGQKTRNHEQSRSSVSIFDLDTSPKIATGQNESTGLICAQEINSKIKKTYRPYCVKCWATFEDLKALEEHAKFCNESCRESSPRELIPISINQCIIAKSDDQCQSSECVMENGSEEVAVNGIEDVAENGSADVAEDNSFEVLKIGSDMMATIKLHGGIAEEANDGLDEVAKMTPYDWAKNSSDGLAEREPDDLASMIHVLAKNAADDLAQSFSGKLANTESYLAKGESDILAMNDSEEVANIKSDDVVENCPDDLAENGSDEPVENRSRRVTNRVFSEITKKGSIKLFSSGSHEFLNSGFTDSTKSRSHSVTKYSSQKVNLIKGASQKLTKSMFEVNKCGSDDALYCLHYPKTFSTSQQPNQHLYSLEEHTSQAYSIAGPKFMCPECEEGFQIGQQLKMHMREVHSVEQPFKCKHCGKQYEKFSQWNCHVQAHRTDRRYVCNKCGKRFKFLHHLKSGHLPCLSDAAELKCPKCNQEFVKASQLRNHLTLCQNERAVQCQVCGRLFLNQSILEKHMRCHTGEKPYQCSQCVKCFSFREGLISHIHRHSTDKPYVCDVCGNAYAVKAFLRSHLRIHTTYWKKCSVGSKINGSSNQVLMKDKEKRLSKRFYGCGLCGSLYMTMISLKRHLPCEEGGAGEKDPLFCGECNEKFREENELQKHIASVHSKNLFSCSICNKMFSKKSRLKRHMRSHTGERPYKCKQCSKGFKHAHHLKKHLPCYVIPGSDIKCNQCQKTFYKISQLRTHISVDHSNKSVQCDVCGKKFVGSRALDIHLKTHVEDSKKPYSCMRCTKCFVRISSLKRHLETVHLDPLKCDVGNKNFHSKYQFDAYMKSQIFPITAGKDNTLYCLNCHNTFSSSEQLKKHLELHKLFGSSLSCNRCNHKFSLLDSLQEHTCQAYSILGPQFRCPECEEAFEISRQLKKHMSEVHSIEHPFKCKRCGKQYEKFCKWNDHVQAHRSDRHYVCNKCGKRFKYLHRLKSDHLPCLSDAAELKCPKCNQEFVKASLLRNHFTLCENELAVSCQHCHRLFLNQSTLDKHMHCHTGEKPYQCSQCDKCFSFRESLISHVHRHSAVKPYVCDVCGKTFAAETILQSHFGIHTTDRPYKCSECDKSFVYACNLRYHKAKVHSGLKERFACSICNKTFCTKMYLKTHMLSHTGQNPYLCSFCGKGFREKILLKYHVRVHTGEKPYTCQYCYMRFSMPRSMRNHERVHTGEKPYECTICGMKFPQSSYLKNHSKKVHKVE